MTNKNNIECEKNERSKGDVITVPNPHIATLEEDNLYHLGLGTGSHDLKKMFGDVKIVCMGGTPQRMASFAHHILDELREHVSLPTGAHLQDITQHSHRYALYKVGPILSVSHGMGVPSISILLHEMIKLMHHSGAKDPVFIRIGTSGGIGLEPGTVVVSDSTMDGLLRPVHEVPILGKAVQRPAELNRALAMEIASLVRHDDPFKVVTGKTMAADDFYEGQGRLDGAFCDYTAEDKLQYLQRLQEAGIVNIEMECTVFAALTMRANIRSAIVCVTLLDRLKGDQLRDSKQVMIEYQNRPQIIAGRYIKKCLQESITNGYRH